MSLLSVAAVPIVGINAGSYYLLAREAHNNGGD